MSDGEEDFQDDESVAEELADVAVEQEEAEEIAEEKGKEEEEEEEEEEASEATEVQEIGERFVFSAVSGDILLPRSPLVHLRLLLVEGRKFRAVKGKEDRKS